MMTRHFIQILLSVWLASTFLVAAQPSAADRRAFEQTKARAEKGDAEAAFSLGSMYASGTGVAQNLSRAFKWHRQAADQGLPRAQYQLALEYASGIGVKPDMDQAVSWMRKAADQGFIDAQVELGLFNLNGEGVRENASEAVRWFRKAADQGDPAGIYQLGKCYLEGTGVAKDTEQGIKLVRQAAEQGYAPAENRLAQCYEKAVGVPKDGVQAYKWFTLAAAQDDQLAVDIRVDLAKLESVLTPEQVTQAQRLAREFKPATGSPAAPGQTGTAANSPVTVENPKMGLVNVQAEDLSAEIFVDGSFVGNPPARLKLRDGTHVIDVKKPGFKDYRREINVSSGSDLTLRAVLEKQ